MKYVKILFLHFQDALEDRSRSFVWFLLALIDPLLLLLFWRGALAASGGDIGGWQLSSITAYYLLLTIASSLLVVHIEEVVAYYDIYQGWLANYLLRPVSYFWYKLLQELPYRLLQGTMGIGVFLMMWLALGNLLNVDVSTGNLVRSLIIALLAFGISFLLKMVLGLSALWTTDFTGLAQLLEVTFLLFGGFIVPLSLFPTWLERLAYSLPFPYIVYFPVVSFQGRLTTVDFYRVLWAQLLWAVVLFLLSMILWRRGVQKFTGVGL